ncbi:MFS transporter [Clostridium sp. chh4-2]|uniref:MFS transporter n=1 Tax=Clostridium sp. chh4-2 TaxID=2067550 RepID=UPI000CCDC9E5|nr:MFS transporter [Clostridium sp. chh4-2]PNV60694.1 MFS transporter [Clostridium sp. chh4-2]
MNRKLNRWTYAVVGIIVLLLAGLVYAWSVFSSPIAAYFSDWTKAQLSLTFTICMGFFCLGGLFGGLLSNKIKTKVGVWISAVLFFVGFFIASKSGSPSTLYIGYGMFCGFASGFVYNMVMSTVLGWFPDKQGLVSGLLLMGFGIGSFIIGKVYQAATPAGPGIDAWRNSFFVFGVVLLVVLVVSSFFFVKPTAEDLAGIKVDSGAGKAKKNESGLEATPSEMLKTSAFWLYFVWAILLSAAGLALISQASGVATEVGPDVNPGTIATVVGLISVFNGIGRLIFGGLFDKIGRAKTMTVITVAFILSVGVVLIALTQKNFGLIVAGFICTGFSYGGINPTNSAFISAFFGRKNYPVNFSIINMNLLISSFGGTIAGALYDASGSFVSTFMLMIGAAVVALLCNFMIRSPKAAK